MKKKLRSSFFGNIIIKPEWLNYHISPDFHAPFAAAGAAMSRSVKKKTSSHWKNLEMSTEGAHPKFLPLLFEMPQGGIMSKRLKENMKKKGATLRFFQLF